MLLENNDYNVRFQQLITIGAKYMAVQNGKPISAIDNLNVDTHPQWSQVSVLDFLTKYTTSVNDAWIHPDLWKMETAGFTCTAPCSAVLPPWTGATAVIDAPFITVSQGTWTSTITSPPMTVSEWVFRKVTIGTHDLEARGLDSVFKFRPTLQPTKTWLPVTYFGLDFKQSTVTPAPQTPPAIPTLHAPQNGKWLEEDIMITMRNYDKGPLADECSYLNQEGYCDRNQDNWDLLLGILVPSWKEWFYDETAPEDRGPCAPIPKDDDVTSTPSATPTTTQPPLAHPSPMENRVNCWGSGHKFKHYQLDAGIQEFCEHIISYKPRLKNGFSLRRLQILAPKKAAGFTLSIRDGCEWEPTMEECKAFYSVNVDSCNCGGVNGKQGGMLTNNCIYAGIWPSTNLLNAGHDEL